jgi:hypothetical protein
MQISSALSFWPLLLSASVGLLLGLGGYTFSKFVSQLVAIYNKAVLFVCILCDIYHFKRNRFRVF